MIAAGRVTFLDVYLGIDRVPALSVPLSTVTLWIIKPATGEYVSATVAAASSENNLPLSQPVHQTQHRTASGRE
jgi:hypothetical protein